MFFPSGNNISFSFLQKLLALDGKMQFERGPVFMNLSTPKVVLLGLPQKYVLSALFI